jgi:hypothetical protein
MFFKLIFEDEIDPKLCAEEQQKRAILQYVLSSTRAVNV